MPNQSPPARSITPYRQYGLSKDDFKREIENRYQQVIVDHDAFAQSEPGFVADTWNAMLHGASSELAGLTRMLGFEGLSGHFQQASANRIERMSEAGRAAFDNELQFDLEQSPLSHWWLNAASALGQFGSSIAGGGLVGAGLKRGALALTKNAGSKAQSMAGTAGTMTGFSAVGGSAATGQTIIEAEQAYDALSDEEKQSSPALQQKMAMLQALEPALAGEQLFGLADAAVRAQIAKDIRTDPRILFANYGLSAVVDPVIGGAIGRTAGSRLLNRLTRSEDGGMLRNAAGLATRSGAHFAKGAAIGAPTEVLQDMEIQRGVARALEGIDPAADPEQVDMQRAMVSGVLGGVAQGSIAALTSRTPPVKDVAADAIRETSPGVAAQMDAMATAKAEHDSAVDQVVSDLVREAPVTNAAGPVEVAAVNETSPETLPTSDSTVLSENSAAPDARIDALMQGMKTQNAQGQTVFVAANGQQISETQARSIAEQELQRTNAWSTPAISRTQTLVGPHQPPRARLPDDQRGDINTPAHERFIRPTNKVPTQREIPGGDAELPTYSRLRGQTLEDSQLDIDVQGLEEAFARLPKEGELLPGSANQRGVPVPDPRVDGFSQADRDALDGQISRKALDDRAGMPMPDGRARQNAQAQWQQTPPLIEKSSTIFAPDGRAEVDKAPVQLKQNGQPFASERSALASHGARSAIREGKYLQAVPVEGGWGWRQVEAPPADTRTAAPAPVIERMPAATAESTPEPSPKPSPKPSPEPEASSSPEQTTTETAATASEPQVDVAPETSQAEQATAREPAEGSITDFGEKIGGARKDVWTSFKDAVEGNDVAGQPLSRSFPHPDYVALHESGIAGDVLAAVAMLRAAIPAKPRRRYRLSVWVNDTQRTRALALDLLEGKVPLEGLWERARSDSDLAAILRTAPVVGKAAPEHYKALATLRIQEAQGLYVHGKPFGQGYFIENDSRVDWSTVTKSLDEAQQHIERLVLAQGNENSAAGNRQSKISLYKDRHTGVYFLGWKGASKVLRIEEFNSVDAARERLANHRDALEEKLKDLKTVPSMRRSSNEKRIGPKRSDKDVTPEQFSLAFGFRGVEFGNWVEQKRRQRDLNDAYDGLMDLAEVLGIPSRALSLNGELGLAFGARGSGGASAASAHFESDKVVINLTKKRGAGSLAHEWFHALDNHLSRARNQQLDFMTNRPYSLVNDPTRKEVIDAFRELMKSITDSAMPRRSLELDERRSKPYWSTKLEMAARSFESYIIAKLKDKGWSNDYLANIVSEDAWRFQPDSYPYPVQSEQAGIHAKFERLFATLETEPTEQGVKFFSQSNLTTERPQQGMSKAQAEHIAADFITELHGAAGIEVEVFATQQDAEQAWGMEFSDQYVRGAFDPETQTAFLIAGNVKDVDEARQVLAHEVIAHGGLQQLIAKDDYAAFIERMMATRSDPEFAADWQRLDHDYAQASEQVKAEELFAQFVETQPVQGAKHSWFETLTNWLRNVLTRVGLMSGSSVKTEMRNMMRSIVDGFQAQHPVTEEPQTHSGLRFSIDTAPRSAEQKIGQGATRKATKSYFTQALDALKGQDFWQRGREGIFDGLQGIKAAEEAAGITDPNQQGYVSARLASGIGDMLHALFNRGALEWRDGVVGVKANTKGLLGALGALPEGKLNDWLAWMAGNRAERLMADGKENNLTIEDIAALKAKAHGHEALFEQVRQDYMTLNKATLELARGAGLLTSEQIATFDTQWYVPFFRESNSTDLSETMAALTAPYTRRHGVVGQTAQIKALLGGTQSTKDLLENIIHRQVSLADAAIKNNAAREVARNLDGTGYMTKDTEAGFAQAAQTLGMTRDELGKKHQRVRIMEHGKPVYYFVHDAALLRGLMQVNDMGSHALFNRMARSAKRFLTTGVTLSPDFIMRNFIRDAAHAWMVNKDGAKLGTDTWKGLKSSWTQSEGYWNLIAGGAAFQGGYIHGADPEAAQQQIRRQLREHGLSASAVDAHLKTIVTTRDGLLRAFEKYRQMSDRLENSNRMTVYERAKAAGKTERQALFEAKDLMDYSLKGNFQLMGTLIDMLPFFNARLQGLYKLGRASVGEGNDKLLNVLSRDLALKGMKVAAFSLALAALNGKDERYKELPEWDKDAHWHFFLGDQHLRLPKPFELGIIFGTLPERMFNFASGAQSGQDLKESVGHAVWNTLAFNPLNMQLILPVKEVAMNKSTFTGAPIESTGDQRRSVQDRYSDGTSDVARMIASMTQHFGVSPKQIEHIIVGYTGTLGAYVLGAADGVARLMTGRVKASTPVAEWPLVRTVYQSGKVQRNTMYQQRFYEALDGARQAYGSYQLALEEHQPERAWKILEARGEELAARNRLEQVQRRVSEINRQMRAVERDGRLTAREKRERLDGLLKARNTLVSQNRH